MTAIAPDYGVHLGVNQTRLWLAHHFGNKLMTNQIQQAATGLRPDLQQVAGQLGAGIGSRVKPIGNAQRSFMESIVSPAYYEARDAGDALVRATNSGLPPDQVALLAKGMATPQAKSLLGKFQGVPTPNFAK